MFRTLVIIGLLAVVPVACSTDDTETAASTTTKAAATTGASTSSTTTIPPHTEPCAALTQPDLVSVGVTATLGTGEDASASLPLGTGGQEAACQWHATTGSDTFDITLAVAHGVDSGAYELVLDDPTADDPSVIDGLGEQAAYRETEPDAAGLNASNQLVVYGNQTLFVLTSHDLAAVDKVQLVGLAAALVPRV